MTGVGEFRAAMALYQDGSFLNPFGLHPVMNHDDTMYIGVFLLDKMFGEEKRQLVLKNCWASPSASPEDKNRFSLISRPGCSDNSMVNIIENGSSSQVNFFLKIHEIHEFADSYIYRHVSLRKFLHLLDIPKFIYSATFRFASKIVNR